MLKDFNTDVNFAILQIFCMGTNHLQQPDFCWTILAKFYAWIFTNTCWENLSLDKITKKGSRHYMCNPTVVAAVTMVASVTKVMSVCYQGYWGYQWFYGHHGYFCNQHYKCSCRYHCYHDYQGYPLSLVAMGTWTHQKWFMLWTFPVFCKPTQKKLLCATSSIYKFMWI